MYERTSASTWVAHVKRHFCQADSSILQGDRSLNCVRQAGRPHTAGGDDPRQTGTIHGRRGGTTTRAGADPRQATTIHGRRRLIKGRRGVLTARGEDSRQAGRTHVRRGGITVGGGGEDSQWAGRTHGRRG